MQQHSYHCKRRDEPCGEAPYLVGGTGLRVQLIGGRYASHDPAGENDDSEAAERQ